MKHLGLIVLIYVACVLQVSVARQVAVGPVVPHFLLLALICVIFTVDGRAGLLWAAGVGLASDALTAEPLGIDMLCAVLLTLAVRRAVQVRPDESAAVVAVVGFLTIFTGLLASTALRLVLVRRAVDPAGMLLAIAAVAAYSTTIGVSGLIVWRGLKRWFLRTLPMRGHVPSG